MKRFLLIFLCILSANTINAQLGFGKPEDIKKVREVTLLVVLKTEDAKTVKKLAKKKDPSKLEEYKSDIVAYNTDLKAAISSTWTFSENVKYITDEELEEYDSKSNKGKYAIFRQLVDKGDNGTSLLKYDGVITTYAYGVLLAGKSKPVYAYMFSTLLPNEADFKFILQQIQNYLDGRAKAKETKMTRKDMMAELNERAVEVKGKTLLVDRTDLAEGLEEKFGSIYKHDHKLTDKAEIDQAILEKNADIAYVKIVPVGQITGVNGGVKASKMLHVQYVIDAADGRIMAFSAPGGLGLGGVAGTLMRDGKSVMKEKDLKKIVEAIGN